MKKLSILALALSVLAASCTKEAGEMGSGRARAGEIRVSAMVNGITKATTDGAVTTFENGDQLSLYVWTGDNKAVPDVRWIDGEVNTFNAETGKWEPKDMMLWKNTADAHYFLGVYPARTITNFTADPFTMNLNPAAKNEVNDLLVATILGEGVKASVNPVPLTMDHLMAKLNISIRFRDQWGGIPDNVTVSVKTAVTGTVDYISKTITPGNDVVEQPVVLVGTDLGDPVAHYASHIIPQTGVTEVIIRVNGTKYIYTHPDDIPFVKGHVTSLPLIVGKDAIVLADEGITIEGWTGGDLPDDLGENAVVVPKITDLSTLTGDYVAQDGYTLTGTLAGNYKISIAAGATVILDNASISYSGKGADYAGLTLIGDGTIQLADGTTNNAIGGLDSQGYSNWPGIFVPEGKTLTINGNTGVLNAARGGNDIENGSPAGIGAAWKYNCGNIVINGGVINATGGACSAGIGGTLIRTCGDITINGGTVTAIGNKWGPGIGLGGPHNNSTITPISGGKITITDGTVVATGGWGGAGIGTGYVEPESGTMTITGGDILISGGTVTATGGEGAAGIGTGSVASGNTNNCGTITITDGVTKVTATKGADAVNSIGQGTSSGTCGTVTIGGVVGAITDSPYVYPLPYPIDLSEVTSAYVGSVISTSDGTKWNVYKTKGDALAASETPSAIIAYVGAVGSVEANTEYKGLAIAFSDADGDMCKWAYEDGNCLYFTQTEDLATALGLIDGMVCTSTLNNSYHTEHNHVAASLAKYNNDPAVDGSSGWFLPSLGQWNLIVKGLATKKAGSAVTTDLTTSNNDTYKASNLNTVITAAGGTGFLGGNYWASTENTAECAWTFDSNSGCASYTNKGLDCYVRSAFAF